MASSGKLVCVGGPALLALGILATRHTLKIDEQADALGWRSQAIDASSHAIVITNINGIIECVNPAFTLITGYSADEALGKTPRILKSGEQNELFYGALYQSWSNGRQNDDQMAKLS